MDHSLFGNPTDIKAAEWGFAQNFGLREWGFAQI